MVLIDVVVIVGLDEEFFVERGQKKEIEALLSESKTHIPISMSFIKDMVIYHTSPINEHKQTLSEYNRSVINEFDEAFLKVVILSNKSKNQQIEFWLREIVMCEETGDIDGLRRAEKELRAINPVIIEKED